MRLNAWLARAGVASRRGADDLIKAGRVTVNGEPGQLNTFVAARDGSSSTAGRSPGRSRPTSCSTSRLVW
jgi:16S rRNA U516 pseudouridylate synthase RsuA-like enzyme